MRSIFILAARQGGLQAAAASRRAKARPTAFGAKRAWESFHPARMLQAKWTARQVHFERIVIPFRPLPFARTSMVKRAGGALLLSLRIDHTADRPVTTQLYVGLRDLI